MLLSEGRRLAGRDVIWFIDNETVCASAIRGTSSLWEVSTILDSAILCLSRQRTRIWYEWIDSKSNPSDGLSRIGISCPIAIELCQSNLWEFEPLTALPAARVKDLGVKCGTVGDME